MKSIILALFFLTGPVRSAEPDYRAPRDVLKADGALTLTDGSSYFLFAHDGVFHSFPVGMSGRTFEGTWTVKENNPCFFTVEAKEGWINGIQPADEYRKIVFVVYGGRMRSVDRPPLGGALPSKEVWDGYFIIDEFTKIPKVAK